MKLSISTTRRENWLGYLYLGFSQLMLPTLIENVAWLLGYDISRSVLNIVYFSVNFIAIVAIFCRFLRQSLEKAWENRWNCLKYTLVGLVIYFGAMLLVGQLILWIDPDFSNANDAAIAVMAQEHTQLILFGTVFLAPVVEEVLYRGLIFQQLHKKHWLLAYSVSAAVFSLIHIVGFFGTVDAFALLLCFVQYLPAGIALAWAYERADTIVAPILMHIVINFIGMSVL